jgi:hypothetical protein
VTEQQARENAAPLTRAILPGFGRERGGLSKADFRPARSICSHQPRAVARSLPVLGVSYGRSGPSRRSGGTLESSPGGPFDRLDDRLARRSKRPGASETVVGFSA